MALLMTKHQRMMQTISMALIRPRFPIHHPICYLKEGHSSLHEKGVPIERAYHHVDHPEDHHHNISLMDQWV